METIFDVIARPQPAASRERPVLSDDRMQVTYADLQSRIRAHALTLQEHGVSRGDRVLVAIGNSIDWVLSAFAIMRLGAIAAPINPDATEREIRGFEAIIEPSGAIVPEGPAVIRFRCPLLPIPTPRNDPGEPALPPWPAGDDAAVILFTSGTTSFPKAAVQPHRVLVHAGEGLAHWLRLTPAYRMLLCMPLFHANALYYSLMGALCTGARLDIAPRFSVSQFWDRARAADSTEVNLMGPMIAMLLRQPPAPDDRNHRLRLVYTSAVKRGVAEEFTRRFGAEIVEGYGLTETPYGCINARDAPHWGSVGRPRQHPRGAISNEVRIASENGESLAEGQIGEIQIRNGATFTKYWNNPTATAAAFRGAWLRTGDIGYRDGEGYFYIVGRAKEMIRRKGVNIAPAEIELVMNEIVDIDEAALVGLPSPLGEELAIAVVTLRKGVTSDGAEQRILEQLRSLVSREKMPDRVVVATELPKTHTERVEKTKLKEWLQRAVLAPDRAAR